MAGWWRVILAALSPFPKYLYGKILTSNHSVRGGSLRSFKPQLRNARSARVWREQSLSKSGQMIRCRLRAARLYGSVCVAVDEITSVTGLCLVLLAQNHAF